MWTGFVRNQVHFLSTSLLVFSATTFFFFSATTFFFFFLLLLQDYFGYYNSISTDSIPVRGHGPNDGNFWVAGGYFGGGGVTLFPLVDLMQPHLLCCQHVKSHHLSGWLHPQESRCRANLGELIYLQKRALNPFQLRWYLFKRLIVLQLILWRSIRVFDCWFLILFYFFIGNLWILLVDLCAIA